MQLKLTETGLASRHRLDAFLEFLAIATADTVESFLEENYVPVYAARDPIERRIADFMEWKARGGFEIVEIASAEALHIETVARHPITDEHLRLVVELDGAPPHRIGALKLGRSPMPPLSTPPKDQAAADAFMDYVAQLSSHGLFSGAVLIARHGRILGQAAHGFANRDFEVPNTLETRFNVASLSKSWTAVAIVQLIEAGELDFEDPVSRFIDYPDPQSAARIQIRHLLSHTAGLGSYFTPEFDRTSRRDMRSVDDFLALTRREVPVFEPGTAWKYSNTGMVMLGKIIERISRWTYFDFVEENVLARAGMKHSAFLELDEVNPDTAVGYHRTWSARGPRVINSVFEGVVKGGPAGCGYATVGDVFGFAEALKGGKLVSPAMVETMTTAKPDLGSPDYGYGFAIHPQRALYGHSGGLVGASANLDITCDPEGWVIVIAANDLSMRAPTLKARQLIGVTVPEAEEGRSYLPRAGLTAR